MTPRFYLAPFIAASLLTFSAPLAPDHSAAHAQTQATTQAAQKLFSHSGTAYSARRYEDYLQKNWSAAGRSNKAWREEGQKYMRSGDARRASGAFASAVVLDKNDVSAWLGLSRAFLAIKTKKRSEQRNYAQNASSSAYLAYMRATDKALKAEALALLGQTLAKRSYWRPALNAYKASLSLVNSKTIAATYEELKSERGFRMLDYSVDFNAANPRACIQFSEKLHKGRVDYTKYISVDGKDPQAVAKQNRQLCVDGLKHGRSYQMTLRNGLPSAIDENLSKDIALTIYVRDRAPSVRFTGRNYVLPKTGQKGIPLVSVNSDEVDLTIYAIGDRSLSQPVLHGNFQQQLSGYDMDRLGKDWGKEVWSGAMPIKSVLNEDVTTAVPVDEALPHIKPGLYVMSARPKGAKNERWKNQATQWFIVSNLGLTAFSNQNGVHAFVRSLGDAEPMANIKVRLLARNNEVLGETRTDDKGYAHFAAGLTRGKDGAAPALLVAQTDDAQNQNEDESKKGKSSLDYAFLNLTRSSFDLTDRGVGGRASPGPLDSYLFTERGVYRPGETVHITALLRKQNGQAAPQIPFTVVITRPDGVAHEKRVLQDQGAGGRSTSLKLSRTVQSGTWRVQGFANPKEAPLSDVTFLVEDYVPERLEMKLNSDDKIITSDQKAKISVDGRFLYGAPASNLALEGEMTIYANNKGIAPYQDYYFGLREEKFSTQRKTLNALPRTDAKGKASVELALPDLPPSGRNLEAKVTLRMREPGGRALEEFIRLPIKPSKTQIGIKPLFDGNHLGEGEIAQFAVTALNPDHKRLALKGLKWELFKIQRRYQWYSRNGSWNYESIIYTKKIANGTLDTDSAKDVTITSPVKYGRYRLEITSNDPNGPATDYNFSAGWYSSDSADTPDVMDIALDKKQYAPGDVATVELKPRSAGKATVAIMSEKLYEIKTVDVPEGGTKVSFTVNENWAPGAYVTALYYRPMDVAAKRMPSRAIGIKWLKVDQKKAKLALKLDLPEKVAPQTDLTIPIKLEGLEPGAQSYLTLAMVDVGILNLTNYKSPKPAQWFYGQRRLGTEIRDLYGRLIDGMQGVRGRIRSGGDAGGLTTSGPPPSQIPLAFYTGIVTVGPDGTAKVNFKLPAFDGTARIMAVAWNKNQIGEVAQDLIIRDPVVMVGTLPRLLRAGDKTTMHLSLDNVAGKEGTYQLALDPDGGFAPIKGEEWPKSFSLTKAKRQQFSVNLDAAAMGTGIMHLRLTGPEGFKLERKLTVPIIAPAPNITRQFVKRLPKDKGKLTLDKALITGLIPASAKMSVHVGQSAAFDVPGLLLSLDRYPYGCAEQLTSRAMPLLYLNQVAQAEGLALEKNAKARIQKAIIRLSELQNGEGAFNLWAPGGGDLWLTAYIADFLTRAKEQNYALPGEVLDNALRRLRNFVNYTQDFKKGGEALSYAIYVLARNGQANIGDMRYYVDTKIEKFASPLAMAQLGASLAMYGDKPRAQKAFNAALKSIDTHIQAIRTANASLLLTSNRLDYGSTLRDGAATFTLASEAGLGASVAPQLAVMMQTLRGQKSGTTTQENAWLILAARTMQAQAKSLQFAINGTPHRGEYRKVLNAKALADKALIIQNRNKSDMAVSVTVTGDGMTPEPPLAKGFQLTREIYTLDGKQINLHQVKQNTRIVVVLKAREDKGMIGRLMLTDHLPAGFEIENPRLVDSGDVKALSWLKRSHHPAHTAFNDDKFQAAFNLTHRRRNAKGVEIVVAYIARAVSVGRYLHPPAQIEDMYRPERIARTPTGWTEITR